MFFFSFRIFILLYKYINYGGIYNFQIDINEEKNLLVGINIQFAVLKKIKFTMIKYIYTSKAENTVLKFQVIWLLMNGLNLLSVVSITLKIYMFWMIVETINSI